MPIHVLGNEEQVMAFADIYVAGKDYVAIITEQGELILEPRKSTRPQDYGYFDALSKEKAKTIVEEILRRYTLRTIETKAIAWDTERPPWVRTSQE